VRKYILSIFLPILVFISINSFAYTLMPAKKHAVITGYTRAVSTMSVTAETSGRLSDVRLAMGDVSDGSVFAVIDPTFTKYDIQSVTNSIKKIDASVERLENNIAYLKKEFGRTESLYLSEVETESRRDAARQSLDQAEMSRDELLVEKESLGIQLSQLNEVLRRQYLKVPAGWTVTTKPLEKGELISAGALIAKAGDFRKLIVPVFVDNAQMDYLVKSGDIDVTVAGVKHKARVNRVSPAFDETTRKRPAEIIIDMSGVGGLTVEIPVETDAEGLMVHKDAVNERYANARVVSNGQEIKVSIAGRDGDMVILAPNEKLKAGMELEAVNK
jgi:multidrug resistance efflux pump